jgi:hypothetical protein
VLGAICPCPNMDTVWVMASTHETPERGGAPALGGAAYEPLNMEVQHARVPLGAGTRIGSDGYFKPESKGSVCRQVVAGPRFEPATDTRNGYLLRADL